MGFKIKRIALRLLLIIVFILISGYGLYSSNWFKAYVVDKALSKIPSLENISVDFESLNVYIGKPSSIKGLVIYNNNDTLLYAQDAAISIPSTKEEENYFGFSAFSISNGFINLNLLPKTETKSEKKVELDFEKISLNKFAVIQDTNAYNFASIEGDVHFNNLDGFEFSSDFLELKEFSGKLLEKDLYIDKMNVQEAHLADYTAEIKHFHLDGIVNDTSIEMDIQDLVWKESLLSALLKGNLNDQIQLQSHLQIALEKIIPFELPDRFELNQTRLKNLQTFFGIAPGKLEADLRIEPKTVNFKDARFSNQQLQTRFDGYIDLDGLALHLDILKGKIHKPQDFHLGNLPFAFKSEGLKLSKDISRGTIELFNSHNAIQLQDFEASVSDTTLKALINYNIEYNDFKAKGVSTASWKGKNGKFSNASKRIQHKNILFKNLKQEITVNNDQILFDILSFHPHNNMRGQAFVDISSGEYRGKLEVKKQKYKKANIAGSLNFNGIYKNNYSNNLDLEMTNCKVWDNNKSRRVDSFSLELFSDSLNELAFHSDFGELFVEATMDWNEILPFAQQSLAKIFPSNFKDKLQFSQEIDSFGYLSYDLAWKQDSSIFNILFPDLFLSKGSHSHGMIDVSKDSIWLDAKIPKIEYKGIELTKGIIFTNIDQDNLQLGFHADMISAHDTVGLKQLEILAESKNDTIESLITIHPTNYSEPFALHMKTKLEKNGYQVQIISDSVFLNNKNWKIEKQDNFLSYKNGHYNISPTKFLTKEEKLSIETSQPDWLKVKYQNIEVGDLFSIFNLNPKIFAGIFHGQITYDLYAHQLRSNTYIKNLNLLGQSFSKSWFQTKQSTPSAPIIFEGNFLHENTDFKESLGFGGELDFTKTKKPLAYWIKGNKIAFNRLKPFMTGFASNMTGHIDAELEGYTDFTESELLGHAIIKNGQFEVDFSREQYSFSDTLFFKNWHLDFGKFKLQDKEGTNATISGKINIDPSKGGIEKLQIFPGKNFRVLSTSSKDNESFYGRVNFSDFSESLNENTFIEVNGPFDHLVYKIRAKTGLNSKITIPISTAEETNRQEFIQFIGTTKDSKKVEKKQESSSYFIDAFCQVGTRDSLEILLESSGGIDQLLCFGNGNLIFKTDEDGNYNMYGIYEVSKGQYLFHFRDLLKKKFKIAQGSTIAWNGDPYTAKLDLQAIYRLRPNIADLLEFSSGGSNTNNRMVRAPVKIILNIEGDLEHPLISFEIEIADAEYANQLEPIMAKIHSDQTELNKHIFTLLLINRFGPIFENPQSTRTNLIFSNMGDFFNTQLKTLIAQTGSEFLKSMDLDLGLNSYSVAGNGAQENAQRELKLALSKTLFNDRIILDVGGNYYFGDESQENTLAGDFGVEYIMTKDGRLRAKVFNKSENDPLLRQNVYKRGVSLSYKREFDKFSDLWSRYFKKMSNESSIIDSTGSYGN